MTLISLLLAIPTGVIVFAIIAGIIILVFIISSTRKKEVLNTPGALVMQKEVKMSTEGYATYLLARQLAFDGKSDDAIIAFKRLLEIEPGSWTTGMMLGNLVFEREKELSFECLKMMERYFVEEGISLDDPALKDLAMNFYMLGYHYNRHNSKDKAVMFQNIAMNSRAFVKDHKAFRKKFPYDPYTLTDGPGSVDEKAGTVLSDTRSMTEEEKLFDRAFKFSGGLFYVEDQNSPVLQDLVKEIKKGYDGLHYYLKQSLTRLPNIHFDIISNLHVNACATKLGSQYFVGITLGTYLILEDMFDKLMASNNVLPEIGDISLETAEKKGLNIITKDTGISFALPNPVYPGKKSRDPVRRQAASDYKFFAFQFIALHEVAHIMEGHVGYLRSLHMPVYSELNLSSTDIEKVDFSMHQAIEKNADMSATIRAFLIASHFMELNKPGMERFYKDWETFIFHWTFAVYCSFRLFGFNQYNNSESRLSPHPPPSVRMALISMAVVGLFTGETFTKIDKNMSVIMFKAVMAAEEALQSIFLFPNTTDIYLNNWESEEIKEYMEEIWTNASDLLPVCKPFSYSFDS